MSVIAAPPADPAPGHYLTDGRRLFRIVSQFATTLSPFAELEDCASLRVERYTPSELHAMDLRSVRQARG